MIQWLVRLFQKKRRDMVDIPEIGVDPRELEAWTRRVDRLEERAMLAHRRYLEVRGG